jgi:class 3 adenylate cyclase/tetratricopeptide (TPR) repeat protein
VQRCVNCGQENPDGARFCNACATPFAEVESVPHEERKVVTVVFADLVGFTSTAERLDPEEIRAILRPYHLRLKTELERFGGTVEKFIGDAVMAVFGAPVAHEDDPERAVRAAVVIRDALVEEGRLEVRIGITTGEALVVLGARPGMGEAIVSGDVVNTAARLQAGAPVNTVLVDEKTYRATERVLDYAPAASVLAKGKADPIQAWEALRPRSRVGVERQGGAALVGRTNELGLLRETLARVVREREPQLLTLVGVPGIGKSRLVFELFKTIEGGQYGLVLWRHGRSLPYGDGMTFWALAEMTKAEAGILESDSTDDVEAKLRAAVDAVATDGPEAAWILRHLAPLVGVEGEQAGVDDRRSEAFAAWRRFFEALAEQRPLALVFEDLHWADDALLDFVDELVEWSRGVPILVLATARPELLTRRTGWGGGKVNSSTILLPPLSGAESVSLLHALLGRSVIDAEVQESLLEHAGGNPLYAEEFVRMVADRPDAIALPESVQGLIAARVDVLPPAEKELLQDAAVIGRVFWVGALKRDRTSVEELLHALARKEFLRRERRTSVAGETEYIFSHTLVREVAYEQIPRGQRAEKHRAVAEWIESLGRPEDHAEMLAHHYLRSLELGRAAGLPAGPSAARARVALSDAGDRAYGLNAYAAAARYYENALALWSDDDPDRPELLFRLGRALHVTSDHRGEQILNDAGAALLAAGHIERAAETEAMLAEGRWTRGDRAGSDLHIERARVLADDVPPSRAKAYVLSQVARYRMLAGDYREAIDFGQQALAMAEQFGLDELRAHALNNIGSAKENIHDDGGIADLEASIEIARAIRSPEAARALNNLATLYWGRGELRKALEMIDESVLLAKEIGHAAIWRHSRGQQISLLTDLGDWETGLRAADEFIASGASAVEDSIRRRRARIRLGRGDVDGALEDVRLLLEHARAMKAPQARIPSFGMATRLYVDVGALDKARPLAEEFVHGVPAGAADWMLIDFAWAAVSLARVDVLRVLLDQSSVVSAYGEAARALLDGEYVQAATVFEQIGEAENAAMAHLRAASKLVADGRPAEAEPSLQLALTFFHSVGASRYVAEAGGLRAARPAAAS